jgi:type IV fimbrial biogenesis protein FimT
LNDATEAGSCGFRYLAKNMSVFCRGKQSEALSNLLFPECTATWPFKKLMAHENEADKNGNFAADLRPTIALTNSLPGCKFSGTSLVELLVALSILLILLTQAVPAFNSSLTSSRLANSTNTFLASIYLARSEAIKRNGRVVICKSIDGLACSTSGDWEQGWIVFHDRNNNAALDSGEAVLQVEPALAAAISFRGNQYVANYISYSPSGSSKMISGAFQAGTLIVCEKSTTSGETRNIVISATGRPRVVRTTVATCPST